MHKQMSLSDLITHIIVEDTNNKECTITIGKTLYTKANMVQDKPTKKRYIHNKNKNKNNFSSIDFYIVVHNVLDLHKQNSFLFS